MANYIDKDEINQLLSDYTYAVRKNPDERVPDKLAEAYFLIASKCALKYPPQDRDELVSEACINMLLYVHRSFDPDREGKNAFSYISGCAFSSIVGYYRKRNTHQRKINEYTLALHGNTVKWNTGEDHLDFIQTSQREDV